MTEGPSDTGGAPQRDGAAPASPWNVANLLTVVRLVLVPLFGWLLLADGGRSAGMRWAAFAVFVLAMLTDRLDGDLARSRGLVTDVGKVLDPIADKALVTMALVGLSVISEVPWWVTGIVLVREWGITLMRFWVIRHGVMAAGRGGKLKTVLQTVGIGVFLMPRWTLPGEPVWDVLAWGFLGAAVLVTVVTGIDYVVAALRLRRTSERAQWKRSRRAAEDTGRPGA